MKRYLVFAGDSYYPSGGITDLVPQSFDTPSEAIAFGMGYSCDWFQVVDRETMTEVQR